MCGHAYKWLARLIIAGKPPHIHIQSGLSLAKYWLEPVALASSSGFPGHELRKLGGLVDQHQEILLKAWHGYFDD